MRKTIAALVVATLVALMAAAVTPAADAQVPELNLDVTINPESGPAGTSIEGSVDPAQAQEECITDPVNQITLLLTEMLAGNPPEFDALDAAFLTALIAALESGAIPFDIGLLYIGAFVDIVSQQPVPGSDQPMWDPFQGQMTITAPDTTPGTYAVAMVCFGLNEDVDPATIADGLAGLSDALDPEQVETAAQRIIPLLIDQDDPLATGVALFCLDNAEGTACAPAAPAPVDTADPPALAVAGDPAFTG